MSKWSEEFEKQYPTVGKLKETTEKYKIEYGDKDDKDKFWIHRDRKSVLVSRNDRKSFWRGIR